MLPGKEFFTWLLAAEECNLEKLPNFFIVGAPKCGTTTLYETLRQHPQVFMPHDRRNYWHAKEPYYFCSELIARPNLGVSSLPQYLDLFKSVTHQKRVGEASALYLYSRLAAERIQQFCPAAKIIALVREPVAMMLSWHADNLRHGHEDVSSFEHALELEGPRRLGKSLPPGAGYPDCLQYRAMATFSLQIERYQRYFSGSQIKVILLDDLAANPRDAVSDILDFLGLSSTRHLQYQVHNERVSISQGDLLKHRVKNWLRGFGIVRLAKEVLPLDLDRWLSTALRPLMSRSPIQSAPKPDFLADLQLQMRPEVERLSAVIRRDLSHWSLPFRSLEARTIPPPHFKKQSENKTQMSYDDIRRL